MSSDVFVLSWARDANPSTAIRRTVELGGVPLARVQDVVLGFDGSYAHRDSETIVQQAGLACRSASASTSMRALFFAAASILGDDVELCVAVGLQAEHCSAFMLASPEAVGRLNLLPRARLAARSLNGLEAALRLAELTPGDVEIAREGADGAQVLEELLEELESRPAQWGSMAVDGMALLVERV